MASLFRLAAPIIALALFPRGEARAQTKIANDDAGFSFGGMADQGTVNATSSVATFPFASEA